MSMTAAELGDRMSAAEFERRLLLEQVRGEEHEAQQQK
jgi:hypothetical protein